MELTERVAYLKGLIEGLGIDDSTKEGKAIGVITEILEELAISAEDSEDEIDLLTQQIDVIDEDLSELYEDIYGDDDDEDEDEDDFDFEGEMYEVTCPSCSNAICLDEDMLDEGEISCPSCGEMLEFDFDDVEDLLGDCGCDNCKKD